LLVEKRWGDELSVGAQMVGHCELPQQDQHRDDVELAPGIRENGVVVHPLS
jgi:hypothetical protein